MKNIYSVIAAFLVTASVFAQAPQKMSYQAVIRNSSNALVTSTPIGMRISVIQGSIVGVSVYVETQTAMTNANGLVSLEIGSGAPVTGTFAGIDWASGPYFIKTETDPTGGTAYTIVGTSELMSVPYALFSANGTPGATGPAGPAGSNAVIDPIATRIALQGTATSSTGVNSSWYPFVTNSFSLGLLGPINSGPDNVTRAWKNLYLNTAATVISDERTKENVAASDLGLSFINNLSPVKYNKIDGDRTHYGLIAQQVKSVLDEANIADFGGWVISDVNDPEGQQALRYEEFISPLIKAVQELTARVKLLEEK